MKIPLIAVHMKAYRLRSHAVRKDSDSKTSVKDIGRLKREIYTGDGIPAAMTRMVIMRLPLYERPGPGRDSEPYDAARADLYVSSVWDMVNIIPS